MTSTMARPIAPGQWRCIAASRRPRRGAGVAPHSAMTDSWIEGPNDQVRGQVDERDPGAEQDDRGLDDRAVEGADGLHREPADSRPGEDDVDDDGAGEELPELQPGQR